MESDDWFELRVERWHAELEDGLRAVYPADTADDLVVRLLTLARQTYADRSPALRRLDLQRTLRPDWFQDSSMLGYAAYTDRYAGTLGGVRHRLDHLTDLGVTYLHLMPVLESRAGENDGGYAVTDYRTVAPKLGSMDDLRALSADLHGRGISLVLDLVLNHVAREHPWAQRARQGNEGYRNYFWTFPDRELPDQYEQTLPEVFPATSPGSFSWDEELGAWVWTTFNSYQWDLDWTNPEVFYEFASIVGYLANAGVDVLRLDAIAFLWKRMGTDCQNQPEVHDITQALRAFARIACPALLFKAEAIVAPRDAVRYLGQGRHHAKVSDLAYHNSLMVQVWSMLASQDVRLTATALGGAPPIPSTTAWINYLRCHDDIGWAVSDDDAAAVGLTGYLHRQFLADFYSGDYPVSFAEGLVFQENPLTHDRRISGMTASLAGLPRAVATGDPDQVTSAIARIRLAYAVVLGWGGIPVVWMGDEIGLPNDDDWAAEPGHEADNRWLHRPRMDWAAADRRHDAATLEGRVYAALRSLVGVRAQTPQLHASVATEVLAVLDPGVLPVVRRHPLGPWVGLYNVTAQWRPYPLDHLQDSLGRSGVQADQHGMAEPYDTLTATRLEVSDDDRLWLPPWSAHWLITSPSPR
ncbi:MAG: alpha-amylase family protein [Nocardioidaceae bacterium]